MSLFRKYGVFIIIISAMLLLGCASLKQFFPGGNQTASACINENNTCGYGTVPPNTIVNTSDFYGKCCEGYACVEGSCRKITEKCAGKGQFCGYGPTALAHPDNMTYYGECCDGECTNGYCKVPCKTSGSCSSNSDCCSGFECRNGQCKQPCKPSGSCSSNSDCCQGYYCNQSMQCAKPCLTSGNCSLNSDCCGGYFCAGSICIPEPQPKIERCIEHRGACNDSSQCCSGLSCVNGVCTNSSCKWATECTHTTECCTGLYCSQTGICGIEKCVELNGSCNTTANCCFDGKCENSTCIARTCASLNESCTSLNCCSGLTCMNYKCVNPCKISGTCFRDSDCCSGYYCNPYGACAKVANCVFENANCTNSSQCCSGLQCNNGQCTKPCKQFGTCASNAECCAGYLCNQSMQCSAQTTQSNYDLCERQCTALGYNDWFCDPETSCGMYGAHLTSGDDGCPTPYDDWDYPNNDYCCCANHTQYNCNSACQSSGYNNGWGTVANGAACGQVDGVIPVDGAVCCCYNIPQQPVQQTCTNTFPSCTGTCISGFCYLEGTFCGCGTYNNSLCVSMCSNFNYSGGRQVHNPGACSQSETYLHGCCCTGQPRWYCCSTNPYSCYQAACPPFSNQISGPYSTQQNCQNNCTQVPQGPCFPICVTQLGFDTGRNVTSFSQCTLSESWRQSGLTLCCCGLNGPMTSAKCQQMATARTLSNPVGHTIYGYYSPSINSTQCRDYGINSCGARGRVCPIWVVEYNDCCLYECA